MAMTFIINARLACIYLIATILLSVVLAFIMKATYKYFSQVFEKYDELNASVQENVTSIRVVKAFVREKHEVGKFRKAADNVYRLFVKAENAMVTVSPIMMVTSYASIILVSWFGANMIVSSELTTGELTSMLTYCMNILMNLLMVALVFVMLTMSLASGKRVSGGLNEKSTPANPEYPVYVVKDGSIDFDIVSFSYNTKAEKPILNDINLKIKSGETIGIIGGTGSSKTSLVNLIARLYDVTEGSVKVGGKDVRDYDIETLRDKVSVVLQSNVLFSGTILDNLRWGNENATEEELVEALKLSQSYDFVKEKYINGKENFVYIIDGKIVAFTGVTEDNRITGLFVDPEYQNKGIGTALINFLKSEYNMLHIPIYARNRKALAFATRTGFIIDGALRHEHNGEVMYTMLWNM